MIGPPVNHHVRPGDLVATTDRITLIMDHADATREVMTDEGWRASYSAKVISLVSNDLCLVLEVAPVGPSRRVDALRVISRSTMRVGWLWAHDVYPVITALPHPGEAQP